MFSDSHSHLNGYDDDQLAAVLAEAKAKGLELIVAVGGTLDSSEATVELARRLPDVIAAAGIHPWWATPADLEHEARLRSLFDQKEVGAIGEMGIDLDKRPDTADLQWEICRMQLRLAKEFDLPVMIHCRGAREALQEMLRREAPVRGVAHGFTGTVADAESWLQLGLYVGIGIRSFTRNYTAEVERAIGSVPLERMLLETDSSPQAFQGAEGLQPATVVEVAEKVGRIHGVTKEEVGRLTTANLRAMLKL